MTATTRPDMGTMADMLGMEGAAGLQGGHWPGCTTVLPGLTMTATTLPDGGTMADMLGMEGAAGLQGGHWPGVQQSSLASQ